jgi:hypothetical protein
VGRKTKLNAELQARLVEVLAAGNYIEAACAYVGIHRDTFFEWLKRGERDNVADREGGYSDFSDAVKKAQAQAEIDSVARVRKAGQDGNWQADAWYLERSHPDRWGRQVSKITHEIRDVRNLSDDELQAIIES